jgi:predicted CXXCH cytochrome family protein
VPYRGYTPNNRVTPQQPVYDGGGATPGVRRARSLLTFEDFRLPSTAMVDSRSVWWVSANGITARRTRQDLPLYVRNIGGTEVPHVECSSCHDPHSPNPLFLRLVNEQSVLCLTCHDK